MNEFLMENLPLFIPVIIIELALVIVALIHILKHKNYRIGNRVIWIVIVLVLQLVGPIAYFVFGREEE